MENQAQLPKSWMLWSTGRDARRLEVFCWNFSPAIMGTQIWNLYEEHSHYCQFQKCRYQVSEAQPLGFYKQTAGFEEANIHHLQCATVFDFQLQVGLAACGGSWGDTGLFGQLFSLFIAKTWQECIRAASTFASTDQAILHGAWHQRWHQQPYCRNDSSITFSVT